MRQRRRLVALVALAAAGLVIASAAADGGPAPGPQLGWDGVRAPGGDVRYVALPAGRSTTVAVVRVRDGRVVRWRSIRGGDYGIPSVAFDGSTDGLSTDGRTLVLASLGPRLVYGGTSRFAVLRVPSLRLRKTIVLPGLWSFDALSPDGATIYAIEYQTVAPTVRYRVRAIDVATGRPRPGAIVDAREPDERMSGTPVTRARGLRTAWAYTLYAKPNGTAFIHALDTRRARAICIELPWRGIQQAVWGVRMTGSADGRTLVLRQSRIGVLATVDLRNYMVRAARRPVLER